MLQLAKERCGRLSEVSHEEADGYAIRRWRWRRQVDAIVAPTKESMCLEAVASWFVCQSPRRRLSTKRKNPIRRPVIATTLSWQGETLIGRIRNARRPRTPGGHDPAKTGPLGHQATGVCGRSCRQMPDMRLIPECLTLLACNGLHVTPWLLAAAAGGFSFQPRTGSGPLWSPVCGVAG